MPGVGDSWYANSPSDPAARYEDFVVRDFIAEIDGKYRTIADREHRFIAGLSMGGYAAVYMAEKYPQLFSYAGGFSAALDAPLNLDERKPEFRASLLGAFHFLRRRVRRSWLRFTSIAAKRICFWT
jgi:S-formylglutathione hydrolase FrmB